MDLAELTEREFTQPLREAITEEDMIATRRLIDSVKQESNITDSKQEVKIYAMDYVLELRDGNSDEKRMTVEKITEWINAKGLEATLDPQAVFNSILENGTSWDKQGGSRELKNVINEENLKRILNLAVKEETKKILQTKWLSR